MSDRYLSWVNSKWGALVAGRAGLPQPVPLDRHTRHRPAADGEVLMGGAPGAELLPTLIKAAVGLNLSTLAHRDVPQWTAMASSAGLMSGPWQVAGGRGARLKALIYDASALSSADEGASLFRFLHESVPALVACGRVVLLGRPPETCSTPERAAMQQSLEGLMRSLGRELRRGATAQLVQISPGAETALQGVLAFLLSPRSAYVSGQVLQVAGGPVAALHAPTDPEQPLAGRTLLVTGAAQGIGEAIVRTLARDGARVVALDTPRQASALQSLASQTAARALAIDLTAADAPDRIAEAARDDGGWDGVVHNAGITRDRSIARMSVEAWQTVLAVNLSAPLRVHQALFSQGLLKPAARIVVVSSISGIAGNRGQTNYAFSKAGLIGWVQSIAPVLAAQGRAINAVAPGFIESAMTAAMPFAVREAGRRLNALKQGGQPVDVAEAVAFLASPDAAGINGQVLRVCGQSILGA